MECLEGQPSNPSDESLVTTTTPDIISSQDPQILEDHEAEAASHQSAETAANDQVTEVTNNGAQASADQGAQGDTDSGAPTAANPPVEIPPDEKEMSKREDEPPCDLENQFILRLPSEYACTVRKIIHSRNASMKDKLKIDLSPGKRHAVVQVEDVSLSAKLVDLPCVIGSLKTTDKKTFYKTADVSQMLVCSGDGDHRSSLGKARSSSKGAKKDRKGKRESYVWKHGITPPLKDVRKKRFRKTTKKVNDTKETEEISFAEGKGTPSQQSVVTDTTAIPSSPLAQFIDSPEVEKEVKRLLCSDAEAVSARWEVIAEDSTTEIECQGFIPGYVISPGISDYKQEQVSPEYNRLQEMPSDSSSTNDDEEDEDEDEEDEDEDEDEDDDEDEDEEEYDYDEGEDDSYEDLEKDLQAKLIEFDQYEEKEGANLAALEIQKRILCLEKIITKIQNKAQRQKNLIMKVENLMLKNHLKTVLEKLVIEEKERADQLVSLHEKLKYFLEKIGEPDPQIPISTED